MSKIIDLITELARPIVEGFGCELWDVEYISEGGQWYLRIYIDRDEGVSIDDCENVSRALDPILDEKDPIPTNYIFEVSSAGLTRQLRGCRRRQGGGINNYSGGNRTPRL